MFGGGLLASEGRREVRGDSSESVLSEESESMSLAGGRDGRCA